MAANPETTKNTITFSLDGDHIEAVADETILEAAKRHGKEIPHLCYQEG
ncbi:MAG TPA: 2Fe-2S iron-sulfur cluster binding domain-containing protein, partial [Methylococcales bacterium]|nr:2Fe-2S iron-sulfur cluster binding domain-containing protein [Methylococcales bacterium]